MNLSAVGCSVHTAPVEVREKLAIDDAVLPLALAELASRYGCESAIISTCNRVELYLSAPDRADPFDADLIAEFLGEFCRAPASAVRRHLFEFRNGAAVGHLFRVASSLDSLVVGEGQIAGQVKRAFELARGVSATGPFLNALFQHAFLTAKRVRTETGIAQGHVSVSSVAVDCVRQVFDHFGDKTVLVIGAGEMGRETLKNLIELEPGAVLVVNRSRERAEAVAAEYGGRVFAWEALDDALAVADIVVSTTGAPEIVVTRERYERVLARRTGGTQVILDIAIPRDFDPRIVHDGDRTCLFNVDDLKQVVAASEAERRKHVAPAERIIDEEQRRFTQEWSRRRNGPLISSLHKVCDAKREAVQQQLFAKLNGKLDDDARQTIEAFLKRFQQQMLHAPIDALAEEAKEGTSGTLRDALRKLFRLE